MVDLYTHNNVFKLFGFPIFPFWTYLMKIIPETRQCVRANCVIYVCITNNVYVTVQIGI